MRSLKPLVDLPGVGVSMKFRGLYGYSQGQCVQKLILLRKSSPPLVSLSANSINMYNLHDKRGMPNIQTWKRKLRFLSEVKRLTLTHNFYFNVWSQPESTVVSWKKCSCTSHVVIPQALFESQHAMLDMDKDALANNIWKALPVKDPELPQVTYVRDGGWLLHRIPWDVGKIWTAICTSFTK